MNTSKEFKRLGDEINQIHDEIQAKYDRIAQIHKDRDALLTDILLEEDILNEGVWDVHINKDGDVNLYGGYHSDRGEADTATHDNGVYRPKLFDLVCDNNWGDFSYTIEPFGVSIRGFDGEVYMYFDNKEKIVPFIKRFGITLKFGQLEKHTRELEALITIHETFKVMFEELKE